MTRRVRSIAGVLTLAALVLSLGERVWAGTCSPGMEMSASAVHDHERSSGADCPPGHHGNHGGEGTPDCPFGPAGTEGGCLGAASLPAAPAAGILAAPDAPLQDTSVETEPDLVLGSALFHPPKA